MELDFVAWLKKRLPTSQHLRLGVGDDAAVLDWASPELVVTTDVLIDGVHFLSEEHDLRRIGYKALAVNLSDLAAMGAKPVGAVVGLVLPSSGTASATPKEIAVEVMEGMLPLAEKFDCPIVGGDTNMSQGPLTIAITAFGQPTEAGLLRRDGAKPGDAIMVTGELGGSILGKHLDFTPLVDQAIDLVSTGLIHAAMDLTDGLGIDLARMCEASNVGAIVDQSAIPFSQAAKKASEASGKQPWQHALSDGEDFELLFTLDQENLDRIPFPMEYKCTQVGVITSELGLQLREPTGNPIPLKPLGYEHQ